MRFWARCSRSSSTTGSLRLRCRLARPAEPFAACRVPAPPPDPSPSSDEIASSGPDSRAPPPGSAGLPVACQHIVPCVMEGGRR